MHLLGIDTATRDASVALLRVSGAGDVESLAEERFGASGASGAEILPAIDACLARAALSPSGIDAVAVSIGPGSFTGLRVGLATARGLALGTSAVVVGVPTLEAVAHAAFGSHRLRPQGGVLCACLDARRGELYAALFRVPSSRAAGPIEMLMREKALSAPELRDEIEAARRLTRGVGELVLAGDGAERHGVASLAPGPASSLSLSILPPRAAVVGRLGAVRLRESGPDDPAALVPRYARAPEAEIKRRKATGAGDRAIPKEP